MIGDSEWLDYLCTLSSISDAWNSDWLTMDRLILLSFNKGGSKLSYVLSILPVSNQLNPRQREEVKWNWILGLCGFEWLGYCIIEECLLILDLDLVGWRIGFFLDRSYSFAFRGREPAAPKRPYSPHIENWIVSVFYAWQIDSMWNQTVFYIFRLSVWFSLQTARQRVLPDS